MSASTLWDEVISQLQHRRDMHRRDEGVIGGLRHVDIIVRMNGFFAPKSSANQLDRTIGNHLIDVHVRLGARTRLPHIERKLTVQLARDHFIGYLADQVGFVPGKFPCFSVDDGCSLLHVPIGMVDCFGHVVISNGEVDE